MEVLVDGFQPKDIDIVSVCLWSRTELQILFGLYACGYVCRRAACALLVGPGALKHFSTRSFPVPLQMFFERCHMQNGAKLLSNGLVNWPFRHTYYFNLMACYEALANENIFIEMFAKRMTSDSMAEHSNGAFVLSISIQMSVAQGWHIYHTNRKSPRKFRINLIRPPQTRT